MRIHPIKTLCLAAALLSGLTLNAAESAPAPAPPQFPPPLPAAMKKWQDARFGMFIHWGPVSLTAQEIGWSRGAPTPIEVYDNLYQQFNPTNFNADQWVSIAQAAGMKYIVLTTKHHDGFCLWDTKLTDYNIMNSPFHRDVVKELAAACKKQGIGFGTYYSVCDWHHPDFPLTSPGGNVKRDKFDLDAYNRYLLGQVSELITNYGPLFTLWNDVPQMFENRGVNTIKLARGLQPDIIINDRTGDGGDYSTPEQTIGGFNMVRPWESCMTLSAHNQWAWGGAKDGVKPLAACLTMLIGAAGGDGNVLLNVGPRPDGMIDPEQAARLKEMGAWLSKYGSSIYGTRGGPWKPTKSLASTRKGNIVYLHILRWAGDSITLPNLPRKIVRSSLLTGGKLTLQQTAEGIVVIVSPQARQAIDTIVKLELDGSAMDLEPISLAVSKSGTKATASNVYQNQDDYSPEKALDGETETRWATDGGTKQAWLEVDLGKPTTFSRVVIDEWESGGKRIQSFELQYQSGNEWKTFYQGTTVGPLWEKTFEPIKAQRVRLNILDATEGPTINEVQFNEK
ncbi:MAG: alpha-L-fucosidase [Verrucomicrobiota bacterium]